MVVLEYFHDPDCPHGGLRPCRLPVLWSAPSSHTNYGVTDSSWPPKGAIDPL